MSEIGHNSGVSAEEAAAAMERALAPYEERRKELVEKAARSKVDDMDAMESAIDFVRISKAISSKARDLLGEVGQPYHEALNAAKAIALRFMDDVDAATETVNDQIKAYNEQRREAARAKAAEQAAAEAALRAKADPQTAREQAPPPPPPEPAVRRAPIRTLTGGRMSETKKWRPKVVDVALVPHSILQTPKVTAAIEQVARDMLKNDIDVPGVIKEQFNTHIIS